MITFETIVPPHISSENLIMPKRTFTLTDVSKQIFVDDISITPRDVGGEADGYGVEKKTLRGGKCDGVDMILVDNAAATFIVLPTRGMSVWRGNCRGVELGWKSPVQGPVHPKFVNLMEPSGLGWLDGFDELLVRCGLESNGAPEFEAGGRLQYPLHGRIANTPAHKVEVAVDGDKGTITVTGVVDEARLFGNKMRLTTQLKTYIHQAGFSITDKVTNLSAEEGELELLYHINFGMPLLDSGSKVVIPAARVAPHTQVAVENLPQWDTYGEEQPGSTEAVFLIDLKTDEDGETTTLLKNSTGDKGVSLTFAKQQLPHFTLWKNRQAAADGYVTGLEPGINFPNGKSFERQHGRVALLGPGESRTFEIAFTVHTDAVSVNECERWVSHLQGSQPPELLGQPDATWSSS